MKKFIWALVVILLATAAFAQETTAGMQGTVKDPTGAVLSKATVEVTGSALIGQRRLKPISPAIIVLRTYPRAITPS